MRRHRRRRTGKAAVPILRWRHASARGRVVLIALLTDDGPSAYALLPDDARTLAELLHGACNDVETGASDDAKRVRTGECASHKGKFRDLGRNSARSELRSR